MRKVAMTCERAPKADPAEAIPIKDLRRRSAFGPQADRRSRFKGEAGRLRQHLAQLPRRLRTRRRQGSDLPRSALGGRLAHGGRARPRHRRTRRAGRMAVASSAEEVLPAGSTQDRREAGSVVHRMIGVETFRLWTLGVTSSIFFGRASLHMACTVANTRWAGVLEGAPTGRAFPPIRSVAICRLPPSGSRREIRPCAGP